MTARSKKYQAPDTGSPSVADTLAQRGTTHGDFSVNSLISQEIRAAMCKGNYQDLHPVAREALDMIAHKMARICSGNPMEPDHWHDIAGYATLAERWVRDNPPVDTGK